MKTIAYRILKYAYMIKKPIVENHAFFTVLFLIYVTSNLQKDFHQDNLSFACL